MNSATNSCLEEWRDVLPTGRILDDKAAATYLVNCLSIDRRIIAVIEPESEAEIIAIVKIANKHRIALYTVSTGHNWGYGTSLPVIDECALLVLSRMTRIVDFDAELGLVTLEPGVTQKHLADYLMQNKFDFYVPTTGIGPSGSIVGNALEHGFGMTPMEDHFLAVTSTRAILADGTVYQSYFAESGAPYAGVWKWGIGPYLDGLFAQGNMGIVTSLQIALVPRAEYSELYFFKLKKEADLEQILKRCRSMLIDMHGIIGGIKLFNRQQLLYTLGEGQSQFEIDMKADFAWMGFGVFRCRKSIASSIRKEIAYSLRGLVRPIFINERRNNVLKKITEWIPGKLGVSMKRQLGSVQYLLDLVNGIPRSDALGLAYQYLKRPVGPPIDPVRDGAGIIWYAPVLPLKSTLIHSMLNMMESVLTQHGFPFAITLTISSEKCAIGVIPIIYEKPHGAKQAHHCYQELWERGNALGCPPYRVNIASMHKLTGNINSQYWGILTKIKTSLDPNHILSPGRYALTKKAQHHPRSPSPSP